MCVLLLIFFYGTRQNQELLYNICEHGSHTKEQVNRSCYVRLTNGYFTSVNRFKSIVTVGHVGYKLYSGFLT